MNKKERINWDYLPQKLDLADLRIRRILKESLKNFSKNELISALEPLLMTATSNATAYQVAKTQLEIKAEAMSPKYRFGEFEKESDIFRFLLYVLGLNHDLSSDFIDIEEDETVFKIQNQIESILNLNNN